MVIAHEHSSKGLMVGGRGPHTRTKIV